MRNADTILGLIRERGSKGLPLERVYKLLYEKDLYLKAYGKIYGNKGAMTHGVTDETPDGMSLDKIDAVIEALRYERYQWLPARRVSIPKKNGKKRPLGMPVWSDKLLQEVLRLILEAYFEPQFSDHSHGFRPKRGCHTALSTTVPLKRFKPKTGTKPQTAARPARYVPTGPLYTSVGTGWIPSATAQSARAVHARTSRCALPTACLPPPGDDRRLDGPSVASVAARAGVPAPSARQ